MSSDESAHTHVWPDDVARLLESARSIPAESPALRARARARLEAAVGALTPVDTAGGDPLLGGMPAEAAPVGAAVTGASPPDLAASSIGAAGAISTVSGLRVLPLAVALLLGAAVGGVVTHFTSTAQEPPALRATPVVPTIVVRFETPAPVSPVPLEATSAEPATTAEPASSSQRRAPRVTASTSTIEPSVGGDLAQERALIDAARGALAHGQLDVARTALDRHRARFIDGMLAAEREALARRLPPPPTP
jgi:hypothetical protein